MSKVTNLFKKDEPTMSEAPVKKGLKEFKNEEVGIRFTIPERPTVKQQLIYTGACTSLMEEEWFIKRWNGAKSLIVDWECDALSDYKSIDLEKETNPKIAEIISWVSLQTMIFMSQLEDVPKNS